MGLYTVTSHWGVVTSKTTPVYIFSNNYVQELTDLSFVVDDTINSGNTIIMELPTYDIGFLTNYQNMSCSFGTNTNCRFYPLANWVVMIGVSSQITSIQYFLLKNMKLPSY